MLNTKVKTDYLITLAEAKSHLRVDTSAEDNYISDLIKSAVNFAENYIDKDIATTTNTAVLKDFGGTLIEIDEGNLISITSIKDEAGTVLAYDSNLDIYDSSFIVELTNNLSIQDVTAVFVTGYSVSTLPPAIRQAIYIKLSDLYDVERSSAMFNTIQTNHVFESLLNYYVAKRVKIE